MVRDKFPSTGVGVINKGGDMTTLRIIALTTLASILGVTLLALAFTFGSFLTSVFQSI